MYNAALLVPWCAQNDASRNEANKDMLRLKKQVDYWKEQAGLPPEVRACGGAHLM